MLSLSSPIGHQFHYTFPITQPSHYMLHITHHSSNLNYLKLTSWNNSLMGRYLIFKVQLSWIIMLYKIPAHRKYLALLYMCDSGVLILYHEFKSISFVLSIPWVHVYTMIPCLYHWSMSIPGDLSNYNSHCPYHEPRNTIFRIAEIKITGIQKYKLQEYQTTNYRNTDYRNTKNINNNYKNTEKN